MSRFVLIPGAGGAAWFWHLVVPQLQARGHDAVAVDLPAADEHAGLPEYTDIVIDAIAGHRDAVVVAQSMGGFTAPMAAERVPVSQLILVVATPRPSMHDLSGRRHLRLDRIEVIVDTELGILLSREEFFEDQIVRLSQLTSLTLDPPEADDDSQFRAAPGSVIRQSTQPAKRTELRDVIPGPVEPGVFRLAAPPGVRVVEATGNVVTDVIAEAPGPLGAALRTTAGAAKRTGEAVTAVRSFLDSLRRQ